MLAEYGGYTLESYIECPYNSIMLSCGCYTEDPDTGAHEKACWRWYVEDDKCNVEGDTGVSIYA